MPTDQPGHLIVEEAPPATSPIENELPTYRAISNRAVVSVICGVLASFSFANLWFLLFSVLAIVIGVLAHRAIRRTPDVLTGARLANAGIAMGLIFGLTVLTYTAIHTYILKREASKFAREYARILKEGSFGDLLLYREPPTRRKDVTGADKQKEYDTMKSKERMMMDQRLGPLIALQRAARARDARVEFLSIEGHGIDENLAGGIYYYAAALFEIEKPAGSDKPGAPRHQHALAIFRGMPKGRHYEWWVEDIRFPYEPLTYQGEVKKPADDGHGHAH